MPSMQYFKPATRRTLMRPLLLCVLFTALSQATEAPLDEVVVEGTRGKLKQMIEQMVQLEDRFYERYNELNTNDDFDMYCAQEARIGTNVKRRYCHPVYETRAMETEGREYAQMMQFNTGPPAGPMLPPGAVAAAGPPPPAIVTIEARREEYKDNLRKVASENPELVRLLRERYELAQRYEATRRKVWGLKPPPEEKETATTQPDTP